MSEKVIPWPGDEVDDRVVIATVITRDTDDSGISVRWLDPIEDADDYTYMAILLNKQAPFYTLTERSLAGQVLWSEDYPNIVPAVEMYEQCGGDF